MLLENSSCCSIDIRRAKESYYGFEKLGRFIIECNFFMKIVSFTWNFYFFVSRLMLFFFSWKPSVNEKESKTDFI